MDDGETDRVARRKVGELFAEDVTLFETLADFDANTDLLALTVPVFDFDDEVDDDDDFVAPETLGKTVNELTVDSELLLLFEDVIVA